jgi:hypothetical protein
MAAFFQGANHFESCCIPQEKVRGQSKIPYFARLPLIAGTPLISLIVYHFGRMFTNSRQFADWVFPDVSREYFPPCSN